LLHLDMVTHPEIALRPDVSLVVIVHGMAKGSFTGKKLGDYITDFDHRVSSLEFAMRVPLSTSHLRRITSTPAASLTALTEQTK
jgi:hypothetical protein